MTEQELDNKFIHLHVHNGFSLKDGVGTPADRVTWSVKNNKTACATTNHGNISDWIQIYTSCKKNKIKPILGTEAYFKRGADELIPILKSGDDSAEAKKIKKNYRSKLNHVTLLAKNQTGYSNLIKLNNEAWINRFYGKPITSDTAISNYHDGVICLSGCASGEINQIILQKNYLQSEKRKTDIEELIKIKSKLLSSAFKSKDNEKLYKSDDIDFDFDIPYLERDDFKIKDYETYAREYLQEQDQELINSADTMIRELIDWWKGIFGNDFYLEMMVIDFNDQVIINSELIKLAQEKDVKLVITNDAHYITKQEALTQKVQMLSDQKMTWQDYEDYKSGKSKKRVWVIESNELYYKTVPELYKTWEEFHKSDIFTEQVFYKAIENTIAVSDSIEEYDIDTAIKMPKLWPNAEQDFIKQIMQGMKTRDISEKRLGKELYKKYQDQISYELKIIKEKGFIDYFLMVNDIVQYSKKNFGEWSVGPGRGCFLPDSLVKLADGTYKEIQDIKYNDEIISGWGNKRKVKDIFKYSIDETISKVTLENGDEINCTRDHKILCIPKGLEKDINNAIWKEASKLENGDILIRDI
jgi:DNA polymerase III alpha subunit